MTDFFFGHSEIPFSFRYSLELCLGKATTLCNCCVELDFQKIVVFNLNNSVKCLYGLYGLYHCMYVIMWADVEAFLF